jgi:hypothetical protein
MFDTVVSRKSLRLVEGGTAALRAELRANFLRSSV